MDLPEEEGYEEGNQKVDVRASIFVVYIVSE